MRQAVTIGVFVFCLAYSSLWLYRAVTCWRNATKLVGHLPLRTAFFLLRWLPRTHNHFQIVHLLLALIFAVALISLTDVNLTWLFLLPGALLTISSLLILGEPPSVLLLGSSQWSTVRLMIKIQYGIHPYRVTALIDPDAGAHAIDYKSTLRKFMFDNMRIRGRHEWQKVVFPLSEQVPLIVLDTRIPSPAVVEETRRIFAENLVDKVLFVVHEDGTSPSIEVANLNAKQSKVHQVKPSTVVHELRARGLTRTMSLKDTPGARQRAMVEISTKVRQASTSAFLFAKSINESGGVVGQDELTDEAAALHSRLARGPGAVADLEDDIKQAESFVGRWRGNGADRSRWIVLQAEQLCRALGELQLAIDLAPEGLVDEKQGQFNV